MKIMVFFGGEANLPVLRMMIEQTEILIFTIKYTSSCSVSVSAYTKIENENKNLRTFVSLLLMLISF
jgi:hypothetical protein